MEIKDDMNSSSVAPVMAIAAVLAGCSSALEWVVDTVCAYSLVVIETAENRSVAEDEEQGEFHN